VVVLQLRPYRPEAQYHHQVFVCDRHLRVIAMGDDAGMAFGQQTGPPATARQVKELLGLLQEAGHIDFRDARGPMGFTQRQAGGRFTRDEATAFIEQLEAAADGDGDAPAAAAPQPRLSAVEQTLRRIPSPQLAAELQRRGWIVAEP
jgi:hypothetical protein